MTEVRRGVALTLEKAAAALETAVIDGVVHYLGAFLGLAAAWVPSGG